MLPDLDCSILEHGDAMAVPHGVEERCAYEGFDLEVVVGGVVQDTPVECFARAFCGTGEQAGGAVYKPIHANSTDGVIAPPFMQEVRQRFATGHFQELIRIKESHPRVPVPKHIYASGVVFFLYTCSIA